MLVVLQRVGPQANLDSNVHAVPNLTKTLHGTQRVFTPASKTFCKFVRSALTQVSLIKNAVRCRSPHDKIGKLKGSYS